MLLLDNDDIARVFDVEGCMESLRAAYLAQARGETVERLRTQSYVPLPEPDVLYCLKTMNSSIPSSGYMALRLTSDVISEARVDGLARREKLPRGPGGTYCGLIVLFSLTGLAPVAMLHDGHIQLYRVACTSALGIQMMAKEDARDLGLLGSSGQAWAHLVAISKVRRLERVRVYSPNRERREAFAARGRDELKLDVTAVASARDAVVDASIVAAATNTSVPIVEGKWLAPGAHVVSIVSGDERLDRRELDNEVLARAQRIVVHSKALAIEQRHGDVAGPVAAGLTSWERMHDLSEIIAGEVPGRSADSDITVFKNNVGLALQFAAVATRVYEDAKRAGIGRELPDAWFLQTVKP